MTPHILTAMNDAIARPAVIVEYRNSEVYEEGYASAASEAVLLEWSASWESRWGHVYDGYCSTPAQGADGRYYCRFRRTWRA